MIYRILFFFGVGWAFSRLRCRLNLYSKWADGRCQFCGVKHGVNWSVARREHQRLEITAREMTR